MNQPMNIGQAAAAAGVSAKMIRHYEQLGLLGVVPRTEAGYRQYDADELRTLRFVAQARLLGFSIKQIGELVGLWRDSGRASREVKALAQRHIAELDLKLREIAQMKMALERLVGHCHGDDRPHCAILDELARDDGPVAAVAAQPRPTQRSSAETGVAHRRAR